MKLTDNILKFHTGIQIFFKIIKFFAFKIYQSKSLYYFYVWKCTNIMKPKSKNSDLVEYSYFHIFGWRNLI